LRRRQLAPFRFGHAERNQLTAARLKKLALGRRCLRGTGGGFVLFNRGTPNAPVFTDFARQRREAAECVEQRSLRVGRSERLMRVLPMQIDQSLPELGQLRKGCRSAIDPRAASSLRVDHAPEQHVVVGRELLFRKPSGGGSRVTHIEFGGEFGAFGAGTQLPRFEAVTEQQAQRVEARLAAIHDTARKHRARPEALPALLAETDARLLMLAEAADEAMLARRVADAEERYRAVAQPLSAKRRLAANELAHRVTEAMQDLAMAGGRLEVVLIPEASPATYGLEHVELRVASHPKQMLGPLTRVASGGELSRIALAIQVVTSEVGQVPTLIFDEVDTGIGGAVAATVGRQLQALGTRRQVLCVTHLAQVAAHADHHFRVAKIGNGATVATTLDRLKSSERVDELARMLSGTEITVKTRAHAKELLEQHRRATS